MERSRKAHSASARKAWRFVGEMEQIADSFAAAGLPDGFHRAAAALYRTLVDFRNDTDIDAERVLTAVLDDA